MCSNSSKIRKQIQNRKDNVTISLFRRNGRLHKLGVNRESRSLLHPTPRSDTDNWGMVEMPWKQTEHQNFRSVLKDRKNHKSCDSQKQDAKNASKNGKSLGKSSQKIKTNSSPAPTVVGAVAAISLMCILPMAMAYGPSPFFPRLSYHKSFVRVPRLQFGLPKVDPEAAQVVRNQIAINEHRQKDRHPKNFESSIIDNEFNLDRNLGVKPTPSYVNHMVKQARSIEEPRQKHPLMSDVEGSRIDDAKKFKSVKGMSNEAMIENFPPETTTLSKKSSELNQAMPLLNPQTAANPVGRDEPAIIRGDKVASPEFFPLGTNKVYNSYSTFNPGQFKENSPEWQMAMLHYLMDMKMNGHKIQEVSMDEDKLPLPTLHRKLTQKGGFTAKLKSAEEVDPEILPEGINPDQIIDGDAAGLEGGQLTRVEGFENPVICKLEPYNICYRFDDEGNLHPLGARRPVRLIRIYK